MQLPGNAPTGNLHKYSCSIQCCDPGDVENQPRGAYKGSSLSRVIENQYFNEALPS